MSQVEVFMAWERIPEISHDHDDSLIPSWSKTTGSSLGKLYVIPP